MEMHLTIWETLEQVARVRHKIAHRLS